MKLEKFRYLAGIVAAHPNRQVVGRTRLQKTVKLLQRLGLPTDYDYMTHYYGPYSSGVQSDIGLLEQFGAITEQQRISQDGSPYYVIEAKPEMELPELKRFQKYITLMDQTDPVVLELAATYDAFREMGSDHDKALERLRRKKGMKCRGGREEQMRSNYCEISDCRLHRLRYCQLADSLALKPFVESHSFLPYSVQEPAIIGRYWDNRLNLQPVVASMRKKLIEVALPLAKINEAAAKEKSIRHGHPSTLHLWWARRPLAACRAVLFASLVDDPDSDPRYRKTDGTLDVEAAANKRAELFSLIEELVQWDNSNNPRIINAARAEIARCVASSKIETGELARDTIVFGARRGRSIRKDRCPAIA